MIDRDTFRNVAAATLALLVAAALVRAQASPFQAKLDELPVARPSRSLTSA